MRDQAYKLRSLVRHATRVAEPVSGPSPRMVIAMGGKRGVGTTMVTVNLAVALAQQGRRAVLVDANLDQPRAADLCGVSRSLGVVDILAAQRDVHEVLQPGPAGLLIVAGAPTPMPNRHRSGPAQKRLIDQLQSLGRHADFVVLDIGTGSRDAVARFWAAADQVMMITTSDADSVMDTYASIKVLRDAASRLPQVSTIVNRVAEDAIATDVHRRIDQSCRRFLSLEIGAAGHVPFDDALARAADHGVPASIQSPTCAASRAIDRIAAMLVVGATTANRRSPGRSAA